MERTITTTGLVLRATKTGESNRILLLLTPERGVISAIAKGALRLKSKLFSATGLFCYAEYTLYEGKTMYTVDEASVKEVFFGLHEDVEAMALAMYCAELAATLSPEGQEARAQLRLLLNTFYFLAKRKHTPRLLKSVYELRALSLAGYMPDMVACAGCMQYDGGAFYFDAQQGQIFCEACARERGYLCNLDAGALNAMRHIVFAPDEELFRFSLGAQSTATLSAVTAQYVSFCVDRPFKSQQFLETVLL